MDFRNIGALNKAFMLSFSGRPFYITLVFVFLASFLFAQQGKRSGSITTGAADMETHLPELEGKQVAVVANQTSRIAGVHLVDTLLSHEIKIQKVFAPEHGFRGNVEAGGKVRDQKDKKTGLPVLSLYGKDKKPTRKELKGIDVILFDIQDVGVRFYTYISTMHYVMEAAAEQEILFMVLDRPNPNGFFIDGPVLEEENRSFVGLHPVPLVHGMTVGEYARMINGEGWLENGETCELRVIECSNYKHSDRYELPVAPSPNLPNMASIYLYPSLGLFEGTVVSVGRGTEKPFQMIGHPDFPRSDTTFLPRSIKGVSEHPKHEGKVCKGYDLERFGKIFMKDMGKLYLHWLIGMHDSLPEEQTFFNDFFDLLAGTDALRKKIEKGWSAKRIRESWEADLKKFSKVREKYLIYPE